MITDMKLNEFMDKLASKSPASGGGSAAAVSGALGAGLVSMVCNLTIDKNGYETVQEAMKSTLKESDALYKRLMSQVDEDTEAFNQLMAAFKMPKNSPDEIEIRSEVIRNAYKKAAQTPLDIAHNCLLVIKLADSIRDKGNRNAISDVGVAVECAFAGLQSAIMNVRINLSSIKDRNFVEASERQMASFVETAHELKTATIAIVNQEIR